MSTQSSDTEQLMIRASRETLQKFRKIAKKNGISVAQAIRLALEHGAPIAEQKLNALKA